MAKTRRTYQPSKRRRSRTFGFLNRLKRSKLGNRFNILRRRRAKGRLRLVTA